MNHQNNSSKIQFKHYMFALQQLQKSPLLTSKSSCSTCHQGFSTRLSSLTEASLSFHLSHCCSLWKLSHPCFFHKLQFSLFLGPHINSVETCHACFKKQHLFHNHHDSCPLLSFVTKQVSDLHSQHRFTSSVSELTAVHCFSFHLSMHLPRRCCALLSTLFSTLAHLFSPRSFCPFFSLRVSLAPLHPLHSPTLCLIRVFVRFSSVFSLCVSTSRSPRSFLVPLSCFYPFLLIFFVMFNCHALCFRIIGCLVCLLPFIACFFQPKRTHVSQCQQHTTQIHLFEKTKTAMQNNNNQGNNSSANGNQGNNGGNNQNAANQPGGSPNNGQQVQLEYITTGNLTGVARVQILTFPNQGAMLDWWNDLLPLRSQATQHRCGDPSRQDGLDWLNTFNTFHSRWGSALVPLDMRRSVHETQTHLGLSLTQW